MGKPLMARATLTLELDTLDDVHTIMKVLKDRLDSNQATREYLLNKSKEDSDSESHQAKAFADKRLEDLNDEIKSLQRILSIVGDDGRADRRTPAKQEESGA